MNISSLIVDARPEALPSVQAALATMPGIEVHAATEAGKLIVTVETDGDADTTDSFGRIGAIPGVMSVAMVYHQFEANPDQEALHVSR